MKRTVLAFMLVGVLLFTAMPVTVKAVDMTPSVTANAAPDIVETSVALIGADGNAIVTLDVEDIVITPLSAVTQGTMGADFTEEMAAAYTEVTTASSLDALIPNLNDVLESTGTGSVAADFAVRDLFDLLLPSAVMDALKIDGNSITLTFNLNVKAEDDVIVAVKCDGEDWSAISSSNIKNNGDGTVTVQFDKLCPILVLINSGNPVPAEQAVLSPQTGANTPEYGLPIAICIVVCLLLAAGAVVLKKRKKL